MNDEPNAATQDDYRALAHTMRVAADAVERIPAVLDASLADSVEYAMGVAQVRHEVEALKSCWDQAIAPLVSAVPEGHQLAGDARDEDTTLNELTAEQALSLLRQAARMMLNGSVFEPVGHRAADGLVADLVGVSTAAQAAQASGSSDVLDAGLARSRQMLPR